MQSINHEALPLALSRGERNRTRKDQGLVA